MLLIQSNDYFCNKWYFLIKIYLSFLICTNNFFLSPFFEYDKFKKNLITKVKLKHCFNRTIHFDVFPFCFCFYYFSQINNFHITDPASMEKRVLYPYLCFSEASYYMKPTRKLGDNISSFTNWLTIG